MRAYALGKQGWSRDRGSACVALDKDVDAVAGQRLPVSVHKDLLGSRPISHQYRPSVVAVSFHSGHGRTLRPLPWSVTIGDTRSRSPIFRWDASLARAPVL